MDTHTQKFKVRLGLFIIGGLAIFTLAIFVIGKQKNLFNPVFKLTTNFYNVSGLEVGCQVRFSGINVGVVDKIKIINDSTVQVDMLIRKNVQMFIKEDSEASLGSSGIIGDRIIIITQGSTNAQMAEDGKHLASVEPVEIDDVILSLQTTALNTEIITKELANVMLKINTGSGTIGRLVHDSVIAVNIVEIVENLKNTSIGLDQTIENVSNDLSEIMTSLKLTASKTGVSLSQMEEIMSSINDGNGTIGKLINDTTTSMNIDQTIINLKETTHSLNENLEALKHSILFRRYFRKKAEQAEEQRLQSESKTEPKAEPKDSKK